MGATCTKGAHSNCHLCPYLRYIIAISLWHLDLPQKIFNHLCQLRRKRYKILNQWMRNNKVFAPVTLKETASQPNVSMPHSPFFHSQINWHDDGSRTDLQFAVQVKRDCRRNFSRKSGGPVSLITVPVNRDCWRNFSQKSSGPVPLIAVPVNQDCWRNFSHKSGGPVSLITVPVKRDSWRNFSRRATCHLDPPFAFLINQAGERNWLQTVGRR